MTAPRRVPWKEGLIPQPLLSHMCEWHCGFYGNACVKVSQRQQPPCQDWRRVTQLPSRLQGLVTRTDTGIMGRTGRQGLTCKEQAELGLGMVPPRARGVGDWITPVHQLSQPRLKPLAAALRWLPAPPLFHRQGAYDSRTCLRSHSHRRRACSPHPLTQARPRGRSDGPFLEPDLAPTIPHHPLVSKGWLTH